MREWHWSGQGRHGAPRPVRGHGQRTRGLESVGRGLDIMHGQRSGRAHEPAFSRGHRQPQLGLGRGERQPLGPLNIVNPPVGGHAPFFVLVPLLHQRGVTHPARLGHAPGAWRPENQIYRLENGHVLKEKARFRHLLAEKAQSGISAARRIGNFYPSKGVFHENKALFATF